MATISFERPTTVNSSWGLKNLEEAVKHPIDLSQLGSKSQVSFTTASENDLKRLTKKYSK